jgi:hypothetical protein
MLKSRNLLSNLTMVGLVAFAVRPAAGQQSNTTKLPVTTLITVLGPNYSAPPALGKTDVIVRTEGQREDVVGWVLAQGDRSSLALAILIDDGTSLGSYLDELRRFIQAQPKSTSLGVFYASRGTTVSVAPFSANHDAVEKKVRLTLGPTSTSTSIYLSLIDVLRKLQPMPGRREVLLIGDGHDRLRGDLPESPDLDRAINFALKNDIVIHTLYARVDDLEPTSFSVTLAQGNLTQMADSTGGQAFFQGLDTPVSFTPFLDRLDMVLHNQYFLTFSTASSKKTKGEFRGFKVTTEERNVSITAPSRIFVPGSPQ